MTSSKNLRVSLNKFAEFVYATPARRRVIVKEQKFKAAFRAAGHKEAEDYIPRFFASDRDENFLERELQKLSSLYGLTPKDSLRNSIGALSALKDALPVIPNDLEYHPIPRNSHDGIIVDNLYISVRPDAIITKVVKGQIHMGAMKFHFPKGHPLKENGGDCVAVILLTYLNELTSPLGTPKHSLCYSLDVPPALLRQAPRTHVRIFKDIEAASEQYQLLWHNIKAK